MTNINPEYGSMNREMFYGQISKPAIKKELKPKDSKPETNETREQPQKKGLELRIW